MKFTNGKLLFFVHVLGVQSSCRHKLVLRSVNNLALCWTLHGGMMSPVVKNCPASYIVP